MRQQSWLSRQYKGHLIILAFLLICLVTRLSFLLYEANSSAIKVVRLHFIALLCGLVIEYRRIAKNWLSVLWTAVGGSAVSLLAFVKKEGAYVFDDHLLLWPWFFLGGFLIIALSIQFSSITKKLTEGSALLLTISFNYWIIANDYWFSASNPIKCLIVLTLLFSAFSLYHAYSYKDLGRGSRVLLSYWTSVIIIILAVDNLLKIYQYSDIEHLPTIEDRLSAFLQYFLLGISSIYIVYNLVVILANNRSKEFGGGPRLSGNIHLQRISGEQVYIADSIIVTIISLGAFISNYFLQFLPVNFLVWIVLTVTPLLLYIVHRIVR